MYTLYAYLYSKKMCKKLLDMCLFYKMIYFMLYIYSPCSITCHTKPHLKKTQIWGHPHFTLQNKFNYNVIITQRKYASKCVYLTYAQRHFTFLWCLLHFVECRMVGYAYACSKVCVNAMHSHGMVNNFFSIPVSLCAAVPCRSCCCSFACLPLFYSTHPSIYNTTDLPITFTSS